MLNTRTGGYPAAHEGRNGAYFPDAVVAPFVAEAQRIGPLQSSSPADTGRCFSLEESKALIIEAMNEFDPKLGIKAAEILSAASFNNTAKSRSEDNPYLADEYKLPDMKDARWNLMEVAPGQSQLMRCLPAQSEPKDYGDGMGHDPANENPYAVIEYQFDGTIDGVIHMAHEMGHMIADDRQREAGYTYKDNPEHLKETQAYFTQSILYNHLMRHEDVEIAAAARGHYAATMQQSIHELSDPERLHDRPMSLLSAAALVEHLQGQDLYVRQRAGEMLQGAAGPKNISEVLAAAGIERNGDMKKLAVSVIGNAVENRPDPYRAPSARPPQGGMNLV